MEITDLMLNDYVIIHCFDGSDIVIKVTRIEGEGCTVYGISKKGSHWANIEDVKPIPLTPEILEKNGFVYNDLPFAQYWEQFGLMLLPYGKGYSINCGLNISMIINSVHELQHALKLFKIKKEIVL